MLSSLSWNIFFATAAMLAAGYYAVTSLLLYRSEITFWIKSGSDPLKKTAPVAKPAASPAKPAGIMGNISLQDGLSNPRSAAVSAEDFIVGEDEPSPEEIELPAQPPIKDDLLIGTVADLLDEIKTLAQLISNDETDEPEIESMFRTLLARYPHIATSSLRDAVTLYICKELTERTPSGVAISDAARWWQDEAIETN